MALGLELSFRVEAQLSSASKGPTALKSEAPAGLFALLAKTRRGREGESLPQTPRVQVPLSPWEPPAVSLPSVSRGWASLAGGPGQAFRGGPALQEGFRGFALLSPPLRDGGGKPA